MRKFDTFPCLLSLLILFASASFVRAQNASVAPAEQGESSSIVSLPDAPVPQEGELQQSPSAQRDDQMSQRQRAEEQMREQEHQRVLGIVPAFGTSYRKDAVPLTGMQKIRLAFHSAVDPVTFGTAFLVAGYREANDDYGNGFGWGTKGYFKRAGAAYLDSFNGTMIGNGILPAVLRQDPRYFRLGHGTTRHRFLYAAATTLICKGDRSGRWEPNFSNIGGNIIAGALSNLYYPSQNSGWGQTISDGLIVTAEGTLGGVFQEFWPDISRKLFHKDPTHGLDDQQREQDNSGSNKKRQPLEPTPK